MAPSGGDALLPRAKPASLRPGAEPPKSGFRTPLWHFAVLCAVTLAAYAPVHRFAFVNYDDPDYVTANFHVRAGITGEGLKWALGSRDAANWFPLTWLSHMLDCQVFGLEAGWHHLTNVLLHAVAVLLLFAFLNRATGARWRSAFVALIFALHPLHVESVAWVAERKDVLSACFWFLTLWCYVRYAERPGPLRYALTLAAFCLGAMSKPMVLTLPFLLLLLDIWPLRRLAPREPGGELWRLVREKLPFFAISAAVAMVVYGAQQSAGAVKSLALVPLSLRVENAVVSYTVYILQMFWPARLAVFYPYPSRFAGWQVGACAGVLAALSVLALRGLRRHPYIAVGWFWYLGTLVPVIGLVQAGAQAHADRYTYVPMVGLSILLAWGAGDLVLRRPRVRRSLVGVALAASCGCAALTAAQLRYWRDSESLMRHALEATTPDNYVAQHNLGNALASDPSRLPEAFTHLEAAVGIRPDSAEAHSDLGTALAKVPGRLPQALAEYQTALRLAPDSAVVHNNLGYALAASGRLPQAIAEYQTALRLKPGYTEALNNLGSALARTPGRLPDAIAAFQEALRGRPGYAEAHNNLGLALAQIPGRLPDAAAEFETALRLQPDDALLHDNLANALASLPGRLPDAIAEYESALRLQPDSPQAHYNLAAALSKIGRTSEAIAHLQAAVGLQPGFAAAHNSLGVALSSMPDRMADAIAELETALRLNPDYAEAHYNLGVLLARMHGRMPEAIGQLKAALRLRPNPAVQRLLKSFEAQK